MAFGSKTACSRHPYPSFVIINATESDICEDITEVDSSSVIRRHEEILHEMEAVLDSCKPRYSKSQDITKMLNPNPKRRYNRRATVLKYQV